MNKIQSGASPASDYLHGTVQGMMMKGYGAPMVETACLLPYISTKPVMESSDLTYNLQPQTALSRKRSRECPINDPSSLVSSFPGITTQTDSSSIGSAPFVNGNKISSGDLDLSFLGDDVSLQVLKQHLEIDSFISQYMESIRSETIHRRRNQSLRLLASIEAGASMRLRSKEDELENMRRVNQALNERFRSLFVENQIWKELARTTESTVIALQSQILTSLSEQLDDAESFCGSNDSDIDVAIEVNSTNNDGTEKSRKSRIDGDRKWWCRHCGKEEAAVLLLPCRHLCLCSPCGSSIHVCPTCHTHKTASVHVNLSY